MRPYGSFSEFYQFVGRGIRVSATPPSPAGSRPSSSSSSVLPRGLGLDEHIDTICDENDMDRGLTPDQRALLNETFAL